MRHLDRFFPHITPATMIPAVLLVCAVMLVIRIGRDLLLAGTFSGLADGVSLSQRAPARAATHAAIGLGVAAGTLFLIRVTESLTPWLLFTALGIGALLLYGSAR
jgi:hypothetical protein